ncbi:MAG TPA: HemK/PrmC family methyltransferase [Patescibacteria group bacterium]|nr:HemK/PrmC family methyltransferase [Patescibacteria group bacterium]
MTTIGTCCAYMARHIDAVDCELIVAHVIGQSRVFVLSHPERTLSPAQQKRVLLLFARRKRGEPLAYLTGKKEFFGLSFFVTHAVLVPRPETETLVRYAINASSDTTAVTRRAIIDVGTGSGNIIIAVAKHIRSGVPRAVTTDFYGCDISVAALAVARKNAKRHSIKNRIKFLRGNALEPVLHMPSVGRCSDVVIIANLPYLDRQREKNFRAHPDARALTHEPQDALWSGRGGLAHYVMLFRQIMTFTKRFPHCRITCACEIDPSQRNTVRTVARTLLPNGKTRIIKDLSEQSRVFAWTKS